MIRRLFQSRLFLRYMLSYLTILLLPLILLTVLIYQSAVRNLRTEIERSHLNQLTQARVTVDARIRELSDIASRIAYDNRLTRYRVHDPYFSSEAIAALDQYKATSSIIGELFLYFHGDERIYSSTGLSSLDVFQSKYSFAGWDKEQVRQDLNTAAFPFMRPADRVMRNGHIEQSMLAYVVPVTPNNPNPHGTLLYLIEEGEFNGLIRSILGSYQGLTYVFDNKGQVLTANRQGETLSAEETRQLFEQPGGIHSLVLGGSRHSVVSVKSDLNGWTYTTVMPSSQFFSRVAHVRSMMLLLFTLVGLIGVFASLLLARRQYSPISQLAEFASSAFKAPAGRGSRASDELEHIRRVLRESSQRAGLQEPYARNHYLLMLLKYGGSESLTPDLLEAFQLRFDRQRYAVLVLEWEGPHDRAEAPPPCRAASPTSSCLPSPPPSMPSSCPSRTASPL
ncbi:cache domain-containing protein [Paenibacillus sp. CC-CFT747]|nr:cache domain-containing protein [Paenibacillus sp. CC-CFT747]